ncbi:hypothetical protein BBF96_09860 [Anoxybacter fermentans]|uniref:Radical SAM core domain-containing protein n=1 Tax=Anoxybacter fermentans TaxID=1323375 RepID=A0A3Q9HQS3_9FIRM|nr:radical SAM protein [Anoxybacter fermentans]AZR73663.1 hypothetical protein BBF96_09860 [Anoxybacter fermentans]
MELPLIDTDLKFFKINKRYYVLDIPSSTLFEIHPKLEKILIQSVHNLSTDYLNVLKREYDFLDWMELIGELQYLIEHQYLTIYSSQIIPYELKEQKINSLTLNVCHDCNMCCVYCYQNYGTFTKESEYMSKEVVNKGIEFLFKESPDSKVFLNISGGEPLLNEELVKYVVQTAREYEDKYEKELKITLITNGTLFEKELLNELVKKRVELIITLDGRSEEHNQMRLMANHRPSYNFIYDRLKWVKESGIKYRIKGIIHHLNLPYFDQILEMYEKAQVPAFQLEPVIAKANEEYALTQSDIEQLKKYYDQLFDRYQKDEFLKRFINLTAALDCIACKKNLGYTCGAGKNHLCITPKGDIYPCHLLVGEEKFLLGNILEGTLDQELRKRFYQPLHVLNRESCKNCWARYFCGGGCVGENYLSLKSLVKPYPPRCQLTKHILKKAIQVYCSSLTEEKKLNLTPERRKKGREIYRIS